MSTNNDFSRSTEAIAYIGDSTHGWSRSLQVVLPALGKVFSASTERLFTVYGKGIEGTLSYKELPSTISEYTVTAMVKTTVTTVVRPLVRIPTNTKDFTMHIKFYEGDHNAKGNKPYAEFVAEISTAEVASLGLDGFDGKGTWKDGLGATAADTLLGPQTLTFTEILGKTYKYNVPASALVINNPLTKALRLEVPELGKEFSDGAWIGKDPQGILYYNDLNDFKVKQSSYHITAVTVTVQDGTKSTTTKFMRIKFFVKSEDDCYAEFVANDPAGVAANLGDGGLTKKGDWKDLDIGCATAAISKPAGTAEITVTANSIHKKATIKCNSMDDATLIAQVIDVKGNLYFKDTSQIDAGVFANWNNDRVVFYSDNMYAKDFTAYFIPFENSTGELGVQVADTKIFKDVKWTTT